MKKLLIIAFVVFVAFACSNDDATVSGTASAGDTVSGITVKLYDGALAVVKQTTTDASGNFVFSGLEEGNYYIGATITIDGSVWDSGNFPKAFFVSDEIEKEISLSLSKK